MKRRALWGVGLALLAGLAAVTSMYYEQVASYLTHTVGSPRRTYEMITFSPEDRPELRLAITGDVGDGGDLAWRMASSIYVVGRDDPYDVLFLLGDNVYQDGDVSLLDERVFHPFAAMLDTGVELCAIVGNHDAMAADGGRREIAMLGMPGLWWSTEVGSVLLVGLDSNQLENPDQLAWLDETLGASNARWKIVAMHQSPYSAGYQGSSKAARRDYVPVFERHGVQLVLSGHDHDYQRSIVENGVTYVVSGAGGGVRRTGSERYTAYSAATPHFVDLGVFSDRLVLQAVDHDLRMFDSVVIEG